MENQDETARHGGPVSEGDEYETAFSKKMEIYAACSKALQRNDIDVIILNTAKNIIVLDEIVRTGVLLLDRSLEQRLHFEQKVIHQAIDFKSQRYALLGV